MRRLLFAVLALVFSIAFQLGEVDAGKGWCRSDPVINVGGTNYSIEIAVQFPEDGSASAVTATYFHVYRGNASASVVSTDSGIDGQGELVYFHASQPWRAPSVYVVVPTYGTYPMQIYVNGVLKATGDTHGASAFL